ncbi:hypothetical protein ACMFMF_011961 [Clarireedia jacksonii]
MTWGEVKRDSYCTLFIFCPSWCNMMVMSRHFLVSSKLTLEVVERLVPKDHVAKDNTSYLGLHPWTRNMAIHLNLLHILQKIIHGRKVPDSDSLRSNEDSKLSIPFFAPVPLPTNASIIFPHWLIQLHANPFPCTSGNFLHITHIHHFTSSAVIIPYSAPFSYFDSPLVNLLIIGSYFLLKNGWSIGIESSTLLSLLPGEHRVFFFLVLFSGKNPFGGRGYVGIIFAESRRAEINHLMNLILACAHWLDPMNVIWRKEDCSQRN